MPETTKPSLILHVHTIPLTYIKIIWKGLRLWPFQTIPNPHLFHLCTNLFQTTAYRFDLVQGHPWVVQKKSIIVVKQKKKHTHTHRTYLTKAALRATSEKSNSKMLKLFIVAAAAIKTQEWISEQLESRIYNFVANKHEPQPLTLMSHFCRMMISKSTRLVHNVAARWLNKKTGSQSILLCHYVTDKEI